MDETKVQIVLDYDTLSGRFNIQCNVQDEVLTTGMLRMALDRMKENYQLMRIKELTNKQENGIIKVQ